LVPQLDFFKLEGPIKLLAKKDGELKWTFQENLKGAAYVTNVFHFNPLSFNSTLPPRKYAMWCKFGLKKAQLCKKQVRGRNWIKKKNHLKTYYQLETKNISKLGSVFLSAFKVRKHIILTPIITWNRLTHKWTVLVARIITNRNFFSLRWNPATLSPLHQKKNWKKRKMKIGIKIGFF
jgi:hypothetical protein